jgi:hypothetical protein
MADNTYAYPRHRPKDRSLRASNADRDAVGEILRQQHVEGRLDTDEFAERYGRCLQAKTYAELDALVIDLPLDAEPNFDRARTTSGRSRGSGSTPGSDWRWRPVPVWATRGHGPRPTILWLALVLGLIVLSSGHLVWLALPLLFFLVVRPLLWHRTPWWGPQRGPSAWGCSDSYPGRGTSVL